MTTLDELRTRAKTFHARGQLDKAAETYAAILDREPQDAPILVLKGLLEGQRGQFDAAATLLARALAIDPERVDARLNLGRALRESGKIADALVEFDRILAGRPDDADALFAKAETLTREGRTQDALTVCDSLTTLHPRNYAGWANRGALMLGLGRHAEALDSFVRARRCNPTIAENHLNEGRLLLSFNRDQEARESFDKAVQINPNLAAGHLGRAAALMKRHNVVSAMVSAERALQLQPDLAEAKCLLGSGYVQLGNLQSAIPLLDEAIKLRPDYAEAHICMGEALRELGRHDDSIEHFSRAAALKPDLQFALGNLLHAKMQAASWDGLDELTRDVISKLDRGILSINPFALQAASDDEPTLRKCSELTTQRFHPVADRVLGKTRLRQGGKIRVGYVSGEFREHATSILMTDIWESHDKDAFEIIGIDTGFNDRGPRRARIEAAMDDMVTVTDLSDQDAALRIAAMQIDVLVNLNGFFGKARPGIFSWRPAPIQVNYLGFPGTLGASYFDYLLADDLVIPEGSEIHYLETIVYLPGCYQANSRREIATEALSRADFGLPDEAFVFCCFNNVYKITPKMFAAWMKILNDVPDSVLWLLESSQATRDRMTAAAEAAGVRADRLVFADPLPASKHLARYRLADLFLDTNPYNAHTTASDALSAGLPILTMQGRSFPGRVAASLLHSLGLTSMVARDLGDYQQLAVELARDRARMANIRSKLLEALPGAATFNARTMTRNLETAFRYMLERAESGLPPLATHIINTETR